MFSKTCEYAIRAMVFIAQKTKDGSKIGIIEIVEGIDAPKHFVAKILQELVRQGLLQSVKGPNGGFYIDEQCRRRSLADVVKAIDGDKLFIGCGLGLKQCSQTHPCPIHDEFQKVRSKLMLMLEKAKVGTFTEALEKKMAFLKR